jgi:hypothetical protein
MNSENYIGKLVLIGLTFLNDNEELVEQYQTHGVIQAIDDNGMMRIRRENSPVFTIPFDEESMSKAKLGIYRERSSGIEIENPDYTTSWSIHSVKEENIHNYKQYGFEEVIPGAS